MRVVSGLLLAGVALAAWRWGGGTIAAERTLQVDAGPIGAVAPMPLLVLTRLGNLPILAPIAIVLAVLIGRRRGWPGALVYIGSLAIFRSLVTAIKLAVDRPRPLLSTHLDRLASGWSFPSAHSADSMAVLLGFGLVMGDRRVGVAAVAISGAIGVSRVLLGVHWPSDVVAGWSLGAIGAMAIAALLPPPREARA